MPDSMLRTVLPDEVPQLRAAADRYGEELMPHAPIVHDSVRREAFFRDQFALDGPARAVWWAASERDLVGFVRVDRWENQDGPGATIRDLFVEPNRRRQGLGRAIARCLFARLREDGFHRVDLSVRVDSPEALAFWRSAGFDIALYQLRQYLHEAAP